jgi:hypothetical protein
MRIAILERLGNAAAQGLTIGELRALMPGYSYGNCAGQLSHLRTAGELFTLRQGHVAVNYANTVPLSIAQTSFAERLPVLVQEAHTARRLRDALPSPTQSPTAPPAADDRRRRDQQLANRTARAIQGDGTYEPAKAPKPPPTVEAVDPSKVQQCTGWTPRWAVTEPITSLPIGQYDTPPSRWAEAAMSGER